MGVAFVASEVSKGAQSKASEAPVREIVKVFSYLDPQYAPAEDIGEDILAYQQYLHATDPAIPLNGILNRVFASTLQRNVAEEIQTRRQDKKELEAQEKQKREAVAAPAQAPVSSVAVPPVRPSTKPAENKETKPPSDWW